MTQTLRNKKGVTLVELLAVIVILGIIAAIAVPTIGGLIARQRANAAVATYDTVVAAAILYAEDETVFTLLSLETNDYIDLKDNVYSLTETGANQSAIIYLKVVGGVVSFYSDAGATTLADVYINGTLVYDTP
ncbi:MAG: prepilin-type N-terminal cleavage/methylation domain-containing protein [Bacillota bacterium]